MLRYIITDNITARRLSPSLRRFLSWAAIIMLIVANVAVAVPVFAHNFEHNEH